MEEIDPISRTGGLCEDCTATGGKLCLGAEGVLFTASETEARGREGGAALAFPVALDLRDATELAGEMTDGREVAFTSGGGGLEGARAANKVDVRDLGAPVAEGALGGSMDDLLLGGTGPEVEPRDEAIVVAFVGFAEVVVAGFFAVEEVAVLERGEEGAVGVLPGEAALALPAPNVAGFKAWPTHG